MFGTITGLPVNDAGTEFEGQHGFHIHTFSAGQGCARAAGHYNPFGVTHGAPTDAVRHVGDLGNISAPTGTATLDITSEQVTLFGDDSVIGRAFVIHASYDRLDQGTGSPSYSGSAGGRIACGTIGLQQDDA
jgi:superoxide dismutase, Cu-Zn family